MGRGYLIAAAIGLVLLGPGLLVALGPVWIIVLIGAAVLWGWEIISKLWEKLDDQ